MVQLENPYARPHRGVHGELAALRGLGGGEPRGVALTGVRALMLAMLEDAVRAYLGGESRDHLQAAAWIGSGRSRWVFSFHTVCETLGLEPSAVRVALQRLRAASPAGRRFRVGKSRPNARQAGVRITLPRVRRRLPRWPTPDAAA